MYAPPQKGMFFSYEDIPTIPVFAQRLLMALEEENLTAQALERIIQKDPVISSRLLRVANSSFFGLSRRVGTLERAIVVLGNRLVQALALSVSLLDTLAYKKSVGHIPWRGFWLHSFTCAWVCDNLVKLGVNPEVRDEAFTCGLLHDLGKPILWIHQAAAYQEILTKIREEGLETHDAEKAILRFDHAAVGGELAGWWKLPECIRTAIRDHHDHGCDTASARLVRTADWLANSEGYSDGLRPAGCEPTIPTETLAQVNPSVLDELRRSLRKKHQDIQEVVELLKCEVR